MQKAFQLVAGHPAMDLVNTLDYRFGNAGSEELLNSYGDVLGFCEQSKILTPKQTRQLRRSTSESAGARVLKGCTELREALSEILYAPLDGRAPSPESLAMLERYFKAALLQRKLCWNHPALEWELAERGPELPLWVLAISASELLTSEAVHRVRACDNPECRWLFLDTSKNHTRRWCDMRLCGNRMKARRFKAQRKA